MKLGGRLDNHLAETRANLKKHSSSLLTASSSGNLRYITCQEALAAGKQWHASAQTLTLVGEYPPSARQSLRETQLSLDSSRRAAERLHCCRSIGAEVKLLKWLLGLREQMLGYPLRRADPIPTEFRLTVTESHSREQVGALRLEVSFTEMIRLCSFGILNSRRVTHNRQPQKASTPESS